MEPISQFWREYWFDSFNLKFLFLKNIINLLGEFVLVNIKIGEIRLGKVYYNISNYDYCVYELLYYILFIIYNFVCFR